MARDRHEEHVTFRRSSLGIKGTFEGVLTTVESCVISDELYNKGFRGVRKWSSGEGAEMATYKF